MVHAETLVITHQDDPMIGVTFILLLLFAAAMGWYIESKDP